MWVCLRCGECCRKLYPEVTPEEISFLLSKLGPEIGIKIKEHLVDYSPYQEEKTAPENKFIRPPCPFLTKDNLCSIHSFKPSSCQAWECGRKSLDEPFVI